MIIRRRNRSQRQPGGRIPDAGAAPAAARLMLAARRRGNPSGAPGAARNRRAAAGAAPIPAPATGTGGPPGAAPPRASQNHRFLVPGARPVLCWRHARRPSMNTHLFHSRAHSPNDEKLSILRKHLSSPQHFVFHRLTAVEAAASLQPPARRSAGIVGRGQRPDRHGARRCRKPIHEREVDPPGVSRSSGKRGEGRSAGGAMWVAPWVMTVFRDMELRQRGGGFARDHASKRQASAQGRPDGSDRR
jgi:hypothetical protein